MLTFLNSAILFGLAAIAIPILIHLFTRQKTRTIYFSSLRFLKELQKQKIRRLKIRQILLMILRTLLILTLIFAFARPTLKSTSSSSLETGAQLTAVIILDNTMSMGREFEGHRLLDSAKKRALDVVDLLRPGDEIYLLHPQTPPTFAHDGPRYSVETIRELIKATELSYQKTDLGAAIVLANQIMATSANINKEIYLICDMQKAGLHTVDYSNGASLVAEDIKLLVLPVTTSNEENLGITGVTLENQILEKGKVVEIKASIKNFGANNVNDKLIHLFVNGKRVGQNVVTLEQGSSANVVFRFVPDQSGFQSGYALLEDDDLIADNRRYFSFSIPDEISVLLVGNRQEDTRYLSLALRPQREVATFINATEHLAEDFGQENIEDYDVIIISNVARVDNAEARKLQQFVSKGGGLMILLGAEVDLRNYNDVLHKRLSLPLLTQFSSASSSEQFLSFGKIDFSHALFRGVFGGEKIVESPHIRFALQVTSKQPLDKIIEYSNGEPFLFESQLQKGHILYLTTGISRDWSDLVFRGLFVPLVNRAVSYLAGTTSAESAEFMIGTDVTYSSKQLTSGTELVMKKPDGSKVKIKPAVAAGSYVVNFKGTDLPGIYQLQSNEKTMAQWAINSAPTESESQTFETNELADLLHASQVREIQKSESLAASLKETRFGRELWKILIATALFLLILEMAIFREKAVVNQNS